MFKKVLRRYSKDPEIRRGALWSQMNRHARRNNFQIYRPHVIWPANEGFQKASKAWDVIGMPDDRRFFLFNTAASVAKVPGDTADIGVRFGTSSYFIMSGTNTPTKTHHMFDSFEGLSEPTPEDSGDGKKTPWRKGALLAEEEVTQKNLHMFSDRTKYYKGWIPARYPEVKDKKFNFVHIDVDLYQPTRDTLEFFYERVSPGGVIICDDYGFASCYGARKAMDEFMADKPESLIHVPTGQSLVVKR